MADKIDRNDILNWLKDKDLQITLAPRMCERGKVLILADPRDLKNAGWDWPDNLNKPASGDIRPAPEQKPEPAIAFLKPGERKKP